MKPRSKFLFSTLILSLAGTAIASETGRVGGSGGRSTVTMDCGANAFIVGVSATGGREGAFGFNLLRKVKFDCRPFNETTAGAPTTQTIEAAAAKPAAVNISFGSATCTGSEVMTNVELFAATFIDRLNSADCGTSTGGDHHLQLNVGGDGGARAFLQCPSAEALFKVEARVGDAIDSMKGFCRAFGSLASLSIPAQINATANPHPSPSSPVKILPGAQKSFAFTVSNVGSATQSVFIGVTGETDLLGGGGLNPPSYKIELLNPSGTVIASKTANTPRQDVVQGVNVIINVTGAWHLRVTNLKKQTGALDVISIIASIL